MNTVTRCPFAGWMPISTNYGGAMTGNIGLVVHVQEGTNSLYNWFDNEAAQVSAHFWISRAGEIQQYVPIGTKAWAEEAGNDEYLSVETEGYDTELLIANQMATLAKLILWGHTTFGWPLELVDHGGHGITTHAHYPSAVPDPAWGGHPCPGTLRSAQLPGVLKLITPPTPPPPPIPSPTTTVVALLREANGDLRTTCPHCSTTFDVSAPK